MGASASVSRIPLRPSFNLASVQEIVGAKQWNENFERQFNVLADEDGTITYEAFVKLYQNNLLAQTSPVGLLKMLQRKFAKALSGEAAAEAQATIQAEQDRRHREALMVPWECPLCGVEDQQGPVCSICTSENPRKLEIETEDAELKAEPPITEREIMTVQILLQKVQALEERVTDMSTLLKAIGTDKIIQGGSSSFTGQNAVELKLLLLQARQRCVDRKRRQMYTISQDIERYSQTIATLSDLGNIFQVAQSAAAQAYLKLKLQRISHQKAHAITRLEGLRIELDEAERREYDCMRETRKEVLSPLLDGIMVLLFFLSNQSLAYTD